jgi:hypothetical protein
MNQEEISKYAFQLWQSEGCPQGKDQEFWFRAETALQQRQTASSLTSSGSKSNGEKEKRRAPKAPEMKTEITNSRITTPNAAATTAQRGRSLKNHGDKIKSN